MRELARTLMIRTLKEAIARPQTGSIADLKLQAEVALAGFEAEEEEALQDLVDDTDESN
jgi:hypothetical protein